MKYFIPLDFICSKCIEINHKLQKCRFDKGFRVNICLGRIVMPEKKPYPECESSCNTCRNDHLGCRADEEEFEYHINTDYVKLIPLKFDRPAVIYNHTIIDRVHGGFIVVCAFIALSFNALIDIVLDGFEKAYRSAR